MDRKTDRARKQRIRALAARTGLRYTQAARLHENGGVRAVHPDWIDAGWTRLLPGEAIALGIVVGSATFHDVDGDLDLLIERFDLMAGLPDGVATVLRSERREEQTEADLAFHHALDASGIRAPRTAGELADALTALGLFRHHVDSDGTHRWRVGELYVTDELDLPDDWRAKEAWVRWTTVTDPAAIHLLQVLGEAGPVLNTTPAELARAANSTLRGVRAGLEGLAVTGVIEVSAGSKVIDDVRVLRNLAVDTTIDVRIDHARIEPVDKTDAMGYLFNRCPWVSYREVSDRTRPTGGTDEEQDDAGLAVLSLVPFKCSTPYGRRGRLTLGGLARSSGLSIDEVVETLFEMEENGVLRWNAEECRMELRGMQFMSLFSIDFAGQEG